MSTVTWLHVSDFHFGGRIQDPHNQRTVFEALLKDVREHVEHKSWHPDFILVTGDIAFSGQELEYAMAGRFFEELLAATSLSRKKVFMVPGNHDVDRKAITVVSRMAACSLASRDEINAVLMSADDRRLFMKKLASYNDFASQFANCSSGKEQDMCFRIWNESVGEASISLIGLNSCWLSVDDDDNGRLAIGEHQVRSALAGIEGEDLCIAFMHHPFDWLGDFDQDVCVPLLQERCDFVLHGHLHRSSIQTLRTPDAGVFILGAGACYRKHNPKYNWVALDLDAGEGTMLLRAYSHHQGGFWTADTQTYKSVEKGEYQFSLAASKGEIVETEDSKKAKAGSVTAGIAALAGYDPKSVQQRSEAEYLRKMQTICNFLPISVINPHASDLTQESPLKLARFYVELETESEVPFQSNSTAAEGEEGVESESIHEVQQLSVIEVVAQQPNVVLLGPPGSGKTTVLNFLVLCLASARLESYGLPLVVEGSDWIKRLTPSWHHGALLPLRIILRQFAASDFCDGTARGLWNYIEARQTQEDLPEFADRLRQLLAEGAVFLLLDGLDEIVNTEDRAKVCQAVADFVTSHSSPGNRYLLTSRAYAYEDGVCHLPGFKIHKLARLSREHIDRFLESWCREIQRLGWKNQVEAERETSRLQRAIEEPDFAPLTMNPLQLTMMASLHFSWGSLPEDRVVLYHEMVKLLLVRWQEARLGKDVGVPGRLSEGELISALEKLAYEAHKTQYSSHTPAGIPQGTLLEVFKESLGRYFDDVENAWGCAGQIVDYIQRRTGLLISQDNQIYSFPHRSYQEYLAGSYLARQRGFPDEASRLANENVGQWHEVILWAVGVAARYCKMLHLGINAASKICPKSEPGKDATDADWAVALLAGRALLEVGVVEETEQVDYDKTLLRVQNWLHALLKRTGEAPREGASAGRVLARLGDPRKNIMTVDKMQFCLVPSGAFAMGSEEADPDAYENEKPAHSCDIGYDYWIGQYPVSNAQFKKFVKDKGYANEQYWVEAIEAGLWHEGRINVKSWKYIGGIWKRIDDVVIQTSDFGHPFTLGNHPLVGVSWYEACAFARWLDRRMRERGQLESTWSVGLPSEAEWEKAARGGESILHSPVIASWPLTPPQMELVRNESQIRRFPWGDKFDKKLANYNETGINTTSAVGSFPSGCSPYGCEDMVGNVWEWTRSRWGKSAREPDFGYPYNVGDGREQMDGGVLLVVRGAAFRSDRSEARCAYRLRDMPTNRDWFIGFRLVVRPVNAQDKRADHV